MTKTASPVAPAQDDYQAQDDMRTLTRAEEIKADKKRHAKALAHGHRQMSALKSVVEGASDADSGGLKEGSKAEEALDAKQLAASRKPANQTPSPRKSSARMI